MKTKLWYKKLEEQKSYLFYTLFEEGAIKSGDIGDLLSIYFGDWSLEQRSTK